ELPTDVVVAIDVSGSMNNDQDEPPQPLTAVKEAAARFINRLGEKDQSGVVTFATNGQIVRELSIDKGTAASTVSAIAIDPKEETGSTNTGSGIDMAATELSSSRHNPDARRVMVVLTDGLPTAPGTTEEAEAFALERAQAAKDAGVNVYAIGLGSAVNMDFVTAIASTPAEAFQALTANDIDRIYQTITSAICEQGAAVIDIVPKSASGIVPLR